MIEGGKTPIISARELQAMGYAGVFWSCASLYMVTKTLFDNFSTLAKEGTSESFLGDLMPFGEFNRFIKLEKYRELEKIEPPRSRMFAIFVLLRAEKER